MARYGCSSSINWTICKFKITHLLLAIVLIFETAVNVSVCSSDGGDTETILSACEHLRSSEFRRSKALGDNTGHSVRIPRCNKLGNFEPVQCSNELNGTTCFCVDEYGFEILGTRRNNENDVNCTVVISECPASSCRMYCPSGFSRDLKTGCSICQCRDTCAGVECPGGQACQPQEVKCKSDPCPPVPTCKRARSLNDLCPVGQPLSIAETVRPFLCGVDPGKPTCPPLYQCLVQSGNDYGVCCPASLKIQKPGICPAVDDVESTDSTGFLCGTPCGHDLECPHMQKCCYSNGCGNNCRQPNNVTACDQAKVLSEILSVNEREGRGYIPQCDQDSGMFSMRQCSRNGLVCWCVDPVTGNKIKGTMGAATMVSCNEISNAISRSSGRSFDTDCDKQICAAICEYGFKNDHNGCQTCECSEPCEGFKCAAGSHCEVAKDPECTSGSALCSSEPVCQPDIVYSNPCDVGTPLVDNLTSEVFYCRQDENQGRAFFEGEDSANGRALTNFIACPEDYSCMKLHGDPKRVCCPTKVESEMPEARPQTMCEYLRDFSEKMEGTEEGMTLAINSPTCAEDGGYAPMQCRKKTIKVTRSQQRKLLEQQNIRQMRKLLDSASRRQKRQALKMTEKIILVRVDNNNDNVPSEDVIIEQIFGNSGFEGRNAKLIDFSTSKLQGLSGEKVKEKGSYFAPPSRSPPKINDMIDTEVEECWCVDGFGTEIPKTKSTNTTEETCNNLRNSLECLDLTCRMGCDYGFVLDADSQCPSCECRDPCEGVTCMEGQECRTVEVSCEGEYCPPVPACLPRKPGQCPFLVPPGNDGSITDFCDYECRSDYHCDGDLRCCSNGCGTQCVSPQMKTACQHLQTIQMHQSVELGIPAKQKYIVQCDATDGSWKPIQCGPDNICWCVDTAGNEKSGTRNVKDHVNCNPENSECPMFKCQACEHGYLVDAQGCRTCQCRDPCKDILCPGGETCELVQIDCTDSPCPKMPICVPQSTCTDGAPLKLSGKEVSCGPQNDIDQCPTTHSCQLNPTTHKGVCCPKTRDVCFESIDENCLEKLRNKTDEVLFKWKFNPRQNKCVAIEVPAGTTNACQVKNIFHSEAACKSVCPVLSQCERLRLKNMLAAKRAGQGTAWFSPKCDPETGSWSLIQCLGQPSNDLQGRAIENMNVCWCADKKGAPMKGSLTRGNEPKCSHRQARRRMEDGAADILSDPVMEELIRQMTILNENDLHAEENILVQNAAAISTATEKLLNRVISLERQESQQTRLTPAYTRCQALKITANFPVACDNSGSFLPTQCNDEVCWCVDSAGNQLPYSNTFTPGSHKCVYTPIEAVEIELHLNNPKSIPLKDVHDTLKQEIHNLLSENPENFRVHENIDGNILLRFDLTDDNKIDTAFALEQLVKQNKMLLYNQNLMPDITQSRFVHRNAMVLPTPQRTNSASITENTFHMIVFILATGSAFLVSIFVVFVMLKRGKNKMSINKAGSGDKYLDYSAPIFVLSANDKIVDKSEK